MRSPVRRRGGPTWSVVVDLVRGAWFTRNWIVLVVVVLGLVATVSALAGQAALPWAIYPAL